MLETAARLRKPVDEQPIRIDDSLNQIRQSVGADADKAIGNEGTVHNPIPVAEREIPIQVPSGETQVTVVPGDQIRVASPESFNRPGSNLLNHMIHGVDRTSENIEILGEKRKKEDKMMGAKNNSQGEGFFTRARNWFYEDKKAA